MTNEQARTNHKRNPSGTSAAHPKRKATGKYRWG